MAFKEKAPRVHMVENAPAHVVAAPMGNPLPWYKQSGLRTLYLWTALLFLSSSTLGYDGSLLNGLQTMQTWQTYFNNPEPSRLGIYSAIPGIGGLAALPFAPYIADNYGRKLGAGIGCALVVAGSIIQIFTKASPSSSRDAMFLCGRIIMGFGSNTANATCPLLITESAHPRHRGKMTTAYNTIWFLGAIIAAWTCFGTLTNLENDIQWRLPIGLQCLMPGILMLTIWFVPESPRWLIAQDRHEEALEILTKYHANGNPEDEFLQWEYHDISYTLQLERESSSNSWAALVRTPGNRKRCYLILAVAFFSQCSGNGLVSYYLAVILRTIGIEDQITQAYINGGLTIWCWLVSLIAAFFVDRIGRRPLFLFAGVGMLVSFSIWTACSAVYARHESNAAGVAVIVMIFIFYGTAGAAWPGLTVAYTVEILPFNIRAKGLMLSFVVTSIASIFNQYVNPLGLAALAWRFYFVYIAILVFEVAVIYFYFVETRGPTLEQIAELFDGEDSAAAIGRAETNAKMASLNQGEAVTEK